MHGVGLHKKKGTHCGARTRAAGESSQSRDDGCRLRSCVLGAGPVRRFFFDKTLRGRPILLFPEKCARNTEMAMATESRSLEEEKGKDGEEKDDCRWSAMSLKS